MAQAHVELRMAVEHAAIDQRGDGDRLLRGEADHHIQVEPLEPLIAGRTVDAGRTGMNEQRHVERDAGAIQRVVRGIVERPRQIRADIAAEHAELVHRAMKLLDRRPDILHRQGGESGKTVLAGCNDAGQHIVVRAAEADGVGSVDEMKIGERVRREDLEVDARLVHPPDAKIGIHERAADIANAVETIFADAKPRHAVGVGADFRPEAPCGAHGLGEDGVGVDVDHLCVGESGHLSPPGSNPEGLFASTRAIYRFRCILPAARSLARTMIGRHDSRFRSNRMATTSDLRGKGCRCLRRRMFLSANRYPTPIMSGPGFRRNMG
jgi:hypothetical protein